eukprot:764477-Hanusia_phi.AAC.4
MEQELDAARFLYQIHRPRRNNLCGLMDFYRALNQMKVRNNHVRSSKGTKMIAYITLIADKSGFEAIRPISNHLFIHDIFISIRYFLCVHLVEYTS